MEYKVWNCVSIWARCSWLSGVALTAMGGAVALNISEIVDAPNWVVSAYLPLSIVGLSHWRSAINAKRPELAKSSNPRLLYY